MSEPIEYIVSSYFTATFHHLNYTWCFTVVRCTLDRAGHRFLVQLGVVSPGCALRRRTLALTLAAAASLALRTPVTLNFALDT